MIAENMDCHGEDLVAISCGASRIGVVGRIGSPPSRGSPQTLWICGTYSPDRTANPQALASVIVCAGLILYEPVMYPESPSWIASRSA